MDAKFKIFALLTVIMTFVIISECDVGDACSSKISCGLYYFYHKCEDGHCICKRPDYLRYDKKTVTEECTFSPISFGTTCSNYSCPSNSSCADDFTCQCHEGYVMIGDECVKANHQKVLQSCYRERNGDAFICDIRNYSICKSGKCVCFDKYFHNITSGNCEHQSSYMKLHNLAEYQVKPGVYCKKESHCISGLKCVNFKCSCPSDCSYDSAKEVCDCGEVPPEDTPVGPIALGVVLGIFIIIFWYSRIIKTISRLQDKKAEHTSSFSTVPHETSGHDSYALNPIQSPSTSQNTYDNPASSSHNGRQSSVFLPEAEPLPTKTNPSFTSQPDMLYPVNPMVGPPGPVSQTGTNPYPVDSSQHPPPHSECGSAPSLPYSIDPPQASFSAPVPPYPLNSRDPLNSNPMLVDPYPSSPSATPFPSSAHATAFPSNPSASAYPSNPHAPPHPLNTHETPYPLNPYMSPLSSNDETADNTAPPAYNPAYNGWK